MRPIVGVTVVGEPIVHRLEEPWTLLMFLSTTCEGCQELWDDCAAPETSPLPADLVRLVITRCADEESAAALERARGATVVMSDGAWADYGVHSGPFFVLVQRGERIATEGVAWSLDQIAAAVTAARTT